METDHSYIVVNPLHHLQTQRVHFLRHSLELGKQIEVVKLTIGRNGIHTLRRLGQKGGRVTFSAMSSSASSAFFCGFSCVSLIYQKNEFPTVGENQ